MTQSTLALIVFLFPLAYSPGPGNLFFAANGARFGLRATVPANMGYHLATLLVTLAIGLGFSAIAAQGGAMARAMVWAGSAYMLYLAARLLRAGVSQHEIQPRPAGFADGAVLMILNPKAHVIILLMFSQFLPLGGAEGAGRILPVLWIAGVFTLNNLLAFVIWTLAGDRLAARFRDRAGARRLNAILGLMLAGVALWMLAGMLAGMLAR